MFAVVGGSIGAKVRKGTSIVSNLKFPPAGTIISTADLKSESTEEPAPTTPLEMEWLWKHTSGPRPPLKATSMA